MPKLKYLSSQNTQDKADKEFITKINMLQFLKSALKIVFYTKFYSVRCYID